MKADEWKQALMINGNAIPNMHYEQGIIIELGKKLIEEAHSFVIGGHSGIHNTCRKIKKFFFLARIKRSNSKVCARV